MVPEHSSNKNKKTVLLLEDGIFFIGRNFGTTQRISGKSVFLTSMAGHLEAFSHQLYKGQNPTSTYPLAGACSVLRSDLNLASKILSASESNHIQITSLAMNSVCKEPCCRVPVKTFGQCPAKGVTKTMGDEI